MTDTKKNIYLTLTIVSKYIWIYQQIYDLESQNLTVNKNT